MNHLSIVIRFVLASATAIVMALSGIAVAQTSSGEVTIAGFDLLSSKRVGRTTFEYEYGVNVQNGTSTDVTDVSVTVSSSTTGVTVLDGSALIGSIASGTTATSADTITVEVDRRVRFSPDQLDVNTTFESLAGEDADNNGVRDDVDELLLEMFPDEPPEYFMALDIARAKQRSISSDLTDEELIENYRRGSFGALCLLLQGENARDISFNIHALQYNSAQRINAYRNYEQRLQSLGAIAVPNIAEAETQCQNTY